MDAAFSLTDFGMNAFAERVCFREVAEGLGWPFGTKTAAEGLSDDEEG